MPSALASAVLFGATPRAAKLLLVAISLFLLAGLLDLGADLGLAAVEAPRRRSGSERSEEAAISRVDRPWLAAANLARGVIAAEPPMSGPAYTPASCGTLRLDLQE